MDYNINWGLCNLHTFKLLVSHSDVDGQLEGNEQTGSAIGELSGRNEIASACSSWHQLDSNISLRRSPRATDVTSRKPVLPKRQLLKEKAALERELELCRSELDKITEEVVSSLKANKVQVKKNDSKGKRTLRKQIPLVFDKDESTDQMRSDRHLRGTSRDSSRLKRHSPIEEKRREVIRCRPTRTSNSDVYPHPFSVLRERKGVKNTRRSEN